MCSLPCFGMEKKRKALWPKLSLLILNATYATPNDEIQQRSAQPNHFVARKTLLDFEAPTIITPQNCKFVPSHCLENVSGGILLILAFLEIEPATDILRMNGH